MARMELPIFSKNYRFGRMIGHHIVPVSAFALVLLLTFLTHQYSDMLPKLLSMHWSIDQGVASHQGERTDIPKHRQWTTVWPTVVRFDRPLI